MTNLTGIMILDAPASALNNAGEDTEARTQNAVAVKFIRTPEGRYPYVSAQAIRFWIRNTLMNNPEWTPSPVFREAKIAYTDAEPIKYAEDDVFGYMRAASKSTDEKKVKKREEISASSTPIDKETGEVTRISPLRFGTMVSITPVRITGDFGVMARQEGDPVPHEHQFYRAILQSPFSLNLRDIGTFYTSKRTGYKNIDSNRVANAKKEGANEIRIKNIDAVRLPLKIRQQRAGMVIRALGRIEGGAKQTLHLTDTAPSIIIFAICKNGNHPFLRLFTQGELDSVIFRPDVFEEANNVFSKEFLSKIYIGWAKGFLDAERKKFDAFIADRKDLQKRITLGHPRDICGEFAEEIQKVENGSWFE